MYLHVDAFCHPLQIDAKLLCLRHVFGKFWHFWKILLFFEVFYIFGKICFFFKFLTFLDNYYIFGKILTFLKKYHFCFFVHILVAYPQFFARWHTTWARNIFKEYSQIRYRYLSIWNWCSLAVIKFRPRWYDISCNKMFVKLRVRREQLMQRLVNYQHYTLICIYVDIMPSSRLNRSHSVV